MIKVLLDSRLYCLLRTKHLDMKYDDKSKTPGLTWAGYVSVKDSYDWNPLNPSSYGFTVDAEDVFGMEAVLWSETITNLAELELMLLPRLVAFSEVA